VRRALVASTYDALSTLVDACIERSVDFLVIAGDAYNSRDRSVRAQFAFKAAMERLDDAGIRVFVAAGNHDPTSGWTAGLTLPDNVHVFSDETVERIAVEDSGEPLCAVYGRSYRRAAETADLARGFSRAADDGIALAVLHTNVGGRTEHEPYAPSTISDLQSARMDYWALGHIHKPEVLTEQGTVAVYAGCTQA
jgi:DNA repair exonuclease